MTARSCSRVPPAGIEAVAARLRGERVLDGHDGRSGARLARADLDGLAVVVKRVPVDGALLAPAGDPAGREVELWAAGVLDRLPRPVAHAVVAAGRLGDEWVTVMRDLGDAVVGWQRPLDAGQTRRLVDALSAVHRTFVGHPPAACLPLEARLGVFGPDNLPPEQVLPLAGVVRRGWERFADLVADDDVRAAVAAVHRDPAPLARVLRREGTTLLHGDLWVTNLAWAGRRAVLLDWALATEGPAVLDFVVFLTGCASQLPMAADDFVDLVRRRGLSTDGAVIVAALGWGLAELGWNKALDVADHPDPAHRQREAAALRWWVDRMRAALDLGLV